MRFSEISRGNIFFSLFLVIFVCLLVSLFIYKSSIVNQFKDKKKASIKSSSVLTFIYLLSFFQYLFLFYIGSIICMSIRYFIFHENDLTTPFPVRSRTLLDDAVMSKSGIFPTSAVISLFLAIIVFIINYSKLNNEERSNESRLQMLFATLPLGPTAFLFGDEYNELVNEIYFKKDNIEQKTTPTQAPTNAPTTSTV